MLLLTIWVPFQIIQFHPGIRQKFNNKISGLSLIVRLNLLLNTFKIKNHEKVSFHHYDDVIVYKYHFFG